MEQNLDRIIYIITYITTIIGALAAAFFAVQKSIAQARARQAEHDKHTVSSKLDMVSIIKEGTLAAEAAYNGFDPDNAGGESKFQHSMRKLDFALEYVEQKCEENDIGFNYHFVKAEIEAVIYTVNKFVKR